MIDVATYLENLLNRVVEEDRLELVHVEYRSNVSPPILRIYIDKPGGVNHQDCQRVSNQIGELLAHRSCGVAEISFFLQPDLGVFT